MKLKKTTMTLKPALKTEGGETGGAAIADRFKLDVDPSDFQKGGPAGEGKKSVLFAMIGSLLALGLLGVITYMLYTNWTLIQNA